MCRPNALSVFLILTVKIIIVVSLDGKNFVVSCPWLTESVFCEAYMSTTSEVKVTVSINEVKDSVLTAFKNSPVIVQRYLPFKGRLAEGTKKTIYPVAKVKFPVYVFQSDKQFRIVVITRSALMMQYDAVVVTPRHLCYSSYYTATTSGYPFIAVFSFQYSKTDVSVKFPITKPFDVNCFANINCRPGKTVRFRLAKYGAWFLCLHDESAHLRNVRVTSDHPVQVISGSVRGWAGFDDLNRDIITTSLLPSTSWGKEYIVPATVPAISIFNIITIKTSLHVTFHETVGKFAQTKQYLHISLRNAAYKYGKTRNTLVVTAKHPFGLYKLFSSIKSEGATKGDACILNLVPVEMWKSNLMYVETHLSSVFEVKCLLVTQAHQDDVVFLPDMKKGEKVFWKSSPTVVGGITYSAAEILPSGHAIRIYVKTTDRRLVLYVSLQTVKNNTAFHDAYAYDYWVSEVYDGSCDPVSRWSILSDGEDNDCDGKIDEELMNGVDDDGDSLVDEDNGEIHSDGQWNQWVYSCDHACNASTKLSVRVRSCVNRSKYGEDCDGDEVQCDEQACPKNCTNSKCFCNAGCASCRDSIFQCDNGCRRGYRITTHCLSRCPKGLTGVGCIHQASLGWEPYKENFHLLALAVFVLLAGVPIAILIERVDQSGDSSITEASGEKSTTNFDLGFVF